MSPSQTKTLAEKIANGLYGGEHPDRMAAHAAKVEQLIQESIGSPVVPEMTMTHSFASVALDGNIDVCGMVLLPGLKCGQPKATAIHAVESSAVTPPDDSFRASRPTLQEESPRARAHAALDMLIVRIDSMPSADWFHEQWNDDLNCILDEIRDEAAERESAQGATRSAETKEPSGQTVLVESHE